MTLKIYSGSSLNGRLVFSICTCVSGLAADKTCQCWTAVWSALQAAKHVLDKLADKATGRLKRSFRKNASVAEGYADDYAYVIEGLLDLYQVRQCLYAREGMAVHAHICMQFLHTYDRRFPTFSFHAAWNGSRAYLSRS